MSSNARYSLRSHAIATGTISTRTRSSGVKITEVDLALPLRKRAIRPKAEPSSVAMKVEETIPEPVLPVRSEREASSTSSDVPAPPSRHRGDGIGSWSGPTAKVWDTQDGQLVVRELPLVRTPTGTPRHERDTPVSTFSRGRPCRGPCYRKPFFRKPCHERPYKPCWKRRGGPGASRWNCRCSGETCSMGAVTTYQSNTQPMNFHCDISIKAPSTHRSSSVYIEELLNEENSSLSYKKKSKAWNAVALPETASLHYSLTTPIIIPVPVSVVVPQPVYYYQPNVQTAYSYVGYNVSCSTRFY